MSRHASQRWRRMLASTAHAGWYWLAPPIVTFSVFTAVRTTSPTPLSITIATRESRLALWQAEHVQTLLQAQGHHVTLLGMTTRGYQILDRTLSKVADLAVHSLKDMPMDLPSGFALACVMEREDPHDALVSPHFARLADLPQGAVVGTASLRRTVLLRALRPDLRIEPLRGNLDTRLRKLDEGQYAAIVLAAAGLTRLRLDERIRHIFTPLEMLPSAGPLAHMAHRVCRARGEPHYGRKLLHAAGRVCHAGTRQRRCLPLAIGCRLGRPGARQPTGACQRSGAST